MTGVANLGPVVVEQCDNAELVSTERIEGTSDNTRLTDRVAASYTFVFREQYALTALPIYGLEDQYQGIIQH